MPKTKDEAVRRSNNEIRSLMLQYFYERNSNATSARGKRGSAVKISDVKAELKARHGLSQPEVQSNLTYLISQGWVDEDSVSKQFPGKRGTLMPSTTSYFRITAAGIDKIEGPGEFTMDKFHGIKIEATGQNIITVGDGNQVDAKYGDVAEALSRLRQAVINSEAPESDKLAIVADIDTIQSQLAKPSPSRAIVAAAWEGIKGAATLYEFAALVAATTPLLARFLS